MTDTPLRTVQVRFGDTAPSGIIDAGRMAACPDCDSVVSIEQTAPGRYHATVEHDDTCPWYIDLQHKLAPR